MMSSLEKWCNFSYYVSRYLCCLVWWGLTDLSLARATGKQTNLAGQTVIGEMCGAWRVVGCDWWREWRESHLSVPGKWWTVLPGSWPS